MINMLRRGLLGESRRRPWWEQCHRIEDVFLALDHEKHRWAPGHVSQSFARDQGMEEEAGSAGNAKQEWSRVIALSLEGCVIEDEDADTRAGAGGQASRGANLHITLEVPTPVGKRRVLGYAGVDATYPGPGLAVRFDGRDPIFLFHIYHLLEHRGLNAPAPTHVYR